MALNCQGNLKIFPFDNPKCPFAIEISEFSLWVDIKTHSICIFIILRKDPIGSGGKMDQGDSNEFLVLSFDRYRVLDTRNVQCGHLDRDPVNS